MLVLSGCLSTPKKNTVGLPFKKTVMLCFINYLCINSFTAVINSIKAFFLYIFFAEL